MAKQQHTKETLNFNSFSGYYASPVQGYGGFNWGDIDYMNASFWQNEKTDWCDTGFQNVIHGAGEAFTWNNNGGPSYGLFESADLNTTFSLKSMVAASAWETNQAFNFSSYTYKKGHGFTLKATNTIYLSQTPQTLDFTKIGKPGDFKNIVAVQISSGNGQYGNTCSYGPYGYTLGNQMAFDNLKVTWNGQIPKSDGKFVATGLAAHGHAGNITAAHLVIGGAHDGLNHVGQTDAAAHSGMQTGLHSELMPLDGSHGGNLTGQFHLPTVEHFGS